MNATITRIAIALSATAALATGAQAEYRCAPAKTQFDRKACAAAQQGPDELRQYVQNMNMIRVNLQMSDYVDRQTVEAWDAQARQLAAKQDAREQPAQAAAQTRR